MPNNRILGVVRVFDAEERWGVVDAPELPGGCFVHFSNIAGHGTRDRATKYQELSLV